MRLRVEANPPERRLDAYIAARIPELSRSSVARLLEEEKIHVSGRVPRKSEPPEPGTEISITVPPPVRSSAEPEDFPIDIRFQDAELLVVSKPPGMVVHPSRGHPSGTLVNALLHHVGDLSGIGGVLRPGIVHRLDRDTSGLLVVAKTDRAHRRLSRALKRRDIRRVYLATSWGHLSASAMTLDAAVARSRSDRTRMAVTPDGRRAVTHVAVLERWTAADFLRVELETGRTHQIRVHLAHIGHPVVGDAVYGAGWERGMSGTGRRWARELAKRVPRQFLHASELSFDHPVTGVPLRFEDPLPPDLAAPAEWARASSRAGS